MATQGQQRIQLGDKYLKNMVKKFGGISPVLEPNFDLSLCETELVGHLDSASPREVVIRVKFLFQLKRLVSGEKYYHQLFFVFLILVFVTRPILSFCIFRQIPGVSLSAPPSQSVGPGK